MELNKGGFPVNKASYWRRKYLDLCKKTDWLCNVVQGEYPNTDRYYIEAQKIQAQLESERKNNV